MELEVTQGHLIALKQYIDTVKLNQNLEKLGSEQNLKRPSSPEEF